MTTDAVTTDARPARRRRWGLWAFLLLVLLPAALFALWTFATLRYTYSSGPRVGYNQKISRKGWVCKTWEGELAMSNVPGQAPEVFRYTVRSDSLARQVLALAGQRVALTYEEHRGVPTSCFGDTDYFATAVRAVNDAYVPQARVEPGAAPAAEPAAPR